ncbi:MAG TPA: WD40 repeat domain-containing protein, partial [Gemmataceae bacterium]|nr:WD40 repeat domain-containing protein [Gemmataceae bacterium]
MSRLCLPVVVIITVALMALDNAAAQPAQPAKARVDQFGDPLPDGGLARIGSTRYRHGGMDLLAFTPDGKSLIFHGGGAIRLMEVASGKQGKSVAIGDNESRSFRRFEFDGSSVALSDDTKVLAFVSMSGNTSVTVVETATGKERKTFRSNELFKNNPGFFQASLALSPDGKYLLVFPGRNGGDRLPLAWMDTTNGQRVHEIAMEKNARIGYAQFTRDGKQVVALEYNEGKGNGNNPKLRVFDAVMGAELRTVEVQGISNFSYELRPDGKTLVASSQQGGPVRLYDYSGKELKEVKAYSDQSQFGSNVMTRDGKQIYIASRGKIVHWDIDAGKEIQKFDAPGMINEDAPFFGGRLRTHILAVSADGKQLAFAGPHAAVVYDTKTGKHVAGGGAGAGIGILKFTPDDKG